MKTGFNLLTVLIFWVVLTLGLSAYTPLYAQHSLRFDSAKFAKRFPTARLIDHGKLDLYAYRDYEGSFNELEHADRLPSVIGGYLLELLDGPVDYYFVKINGQFDEVKSEEGFQKKIGEWFAGDDSLIQYIQNKKIKMEYLPYLVRMYNSHALRPFNPESERVHIELVNDGFTDERDGRSYDIIIVNNLTWLAENLRYCPWENSCNKEFPNGVYYPWKVATEVCPPGWRLPDETDWKTLFLGYGLPLQRVNKIFGYDKDGALAKKMLLDSVNSKGFAAIPKNELDRFWSYQENSKSHAYAILINRSNKRRVDNVDYTIPKKSQHCAVRCVK